MRALAIVVLCLLPSLAAAQAPAKLGYQGRLLLSDGTPATGTVSMGFAIFSADQGGSSLWSETQSVPLTDGYYATYLGAVTPLPGGLFDGRELWLEVSVGGATLTPRQRVTSVGYSLLATDAVNVKGGTVAASSATVGGSPVLTQVAHDATLTGDGATKALGIDPAKVQARIATNCTAGNFVTGVGQDGTPSCAAPAAGAVSHDNTLTGNGASTPLAVDPTKVQARIATNCTAGNFVTGVGQDGTPSCAAPAAGAVSHDNTLTGNGASTPLAVDPTKVQARIASNCTAGNFVTGVGQDGTPSCAAATGVPTGAIMFFNAASCPSGWSEFTQARGLYIVGLPSGGTLAKVTGTALSDGENRPVGQHTHLVTDPGHVHGITDPGHIHTNNVGAGVSGTFLGSSQLAPNTANTGSATTGITIKSATTGLTLQNTGTVVGTPAPYIELLVCQKN